MRVAGTAAALVLAAGLAATSSAAAPSPPRARTWRALLARTDAAEKRLAALVERAAVDPHLEAVLAYEAFGEKEMADPKRTVVVEASKDAQVGLMDLVTDATVSPDVREAAAKAIASDAALRNDPALSMEGRRQNRPRIQFSLRVVRLLSARDDVLTRTLANGILAGVWRTVPDADARAYDPRKDSTWGNARSSWQKFLGKQGGS